MKYALLSELGHVRVASPEGGAFLLGKVHAMSIQYQTQITGHIAPVLQIATVSFTSRVKISGSPTRWTGDSRWGRLSYAAYAPARHAPAHTLVHLFFSADICNHYLSRQFLRSLFDQAEQLPMRILRGTWGRGVFPGIISAPWLRCCLQLGIGHTEREINPGSEKGWRYPIPVIVES